MADLLDRIDATVDGLCACGCGQPLDPSGPSAWFTSEACQAAYYWQGTIRPQEEVRGSTGAEPRPARWRPDLVDMPDDSDLTLVSSREMGPRGPTRCVYLHRDGSVFLRVDDGHRAVGTFMERDEYSRASGLGELWLVWGQLARELTDARRLDSAHDRLPPTPLLEGQTTEEFTAAVAGWMQQEQRRAALCDWLRANGIDPDWVPVDAAIECDGHTIRCELFVARWPAEPVRSWVTVPMTVPPPGAEVRFEGWENR